MSQQESARKADMTLVGDREIHVEREFDAPRERVFAAYTDPELIPQWWGPRGTTTTVDELDAATGGRWQFRMPNPDGSEIVFRGVFREVTTPERIVQTFEWDGMPGHVSVDAAVFEDLGDGRTRVVTGWADAGAGEGGGEGVEQGRALGPVALAGTADVTVEGTAGDQIRQRPLVDAGAAAGEVDEELMARVRDRFGVRGALELVHLIAWENARARINVALDIEPEGFSEGKVCAVPDRAFAAAAAQP